jgi:UDP-glucose:(heptosyl)LPS alpha-1,3-glucosyltransferase
LVQAQRTLRVGFLIDRWQPARGGAERALASLAQHLEERGHGVHAFAERGPAPGESAPGRVHLVRARRLMLTRGARERAFDAAARSAAEALGCDVTVGVRHVGRVDLYWPHGGSHARSVAAWQEARAWHDGSPIERGSPIGRGVPVLRGRHRAFVAFERRLLDGGAARAVACVSHLVERELAADFPAARERLVVVRNGIDLEHYHPRHRAAAGARLRATLGIDAAPPILAFAARQPVLKGLPVLFAALARLRDRPWVLVAAGMRDAGAWSRRARAAGLDERRVRIASEIDAQVLLAGSDVCVLPTWRDTSGLVVLEALACGTPVITTARAGECSAIGPHAGQVLPHPGDAQALAQAVSAWLDRAPRVERDALRACVADRGLTAWLERLEALLLELAR